MSPSKLLLCLFALIGGLASHAATINWSAAIDHGLSSQSGAELPVDSIVRLGWFRDPTTNTPLSDAQIQAIAGSTTVLDAHFVEVGASTIGAGLTGISGHFSAVTGADTAALNLVGKQMYVWVLNATTIAAADQQAILYWDINDTTTNPDTAPAAPGNRWAFPAQAPIPGSTTIDLTDLTTGSGSLATGARIVVGSYPKGTSGTTQAANFGLAPVTSALTINSNATLATGIKNQAYNQTVTATGGNGSYTWTVTGGALPQGLTLGTNGAITGTPTEDGSFTATVQVEDAASHTASKAFTLLVAGAPLQILTAVALPDAVQDSPYSTALTSSGGITPHVWSLTGGSLPNGVSLASDGQLSGTPTLAGSYEFEATVTDASGQLLEKAFTLMVTYEPLIASPGTLIPGVIRLAYSYQFEIADSRPYTWALTTGTLPAGLKLSPTGLLSGKATAAGTSVFTLSAVGAGNVTATKQFSLTILATNVAPSLVTPQFPDTIVGNSGYRYQIVASPQPTSISVIGLPPGMVVNAVTGVVTGAPTASGIFVVKVRARNAVGSSPEVLATIDVKPLPNGAVGTFAALVARDPAVNADLGGRIDLAVTVAGSYTLRLTQGSAVVLVKGVVLTRPDGSNPRVQTTLAGLPITMTLDHANDRLTGTLSSGGSTAAITGWRQIWHPTNRPTTTQAGYYAVAMDLTTHIDSESVPQGTSFARFTVANDGWYAVAGSTANGSVITGSAFLSPTNEVLVYLRNTSNYGVVLGTLALTTNPAGSVVDNSITGSVVWKKNTSATNAYPVAFGPVTLRAEGKYLARAVVATSNILGLPTATPACALTFTKGGIESSRIDPSVPFNFTNQKPVLPAGVLNPAGTSLAINVKDGTLSGKFTLVDVRSRRTASYSGMIVRTSDNAVKGVGYFLLPKPVVLGQAGTQLQMSGKVRITQSSGN